MTTFECTGITGYKSENSPVLIYEKKRGLIFYQHSGNTSGGEFYFNLPRGVYATENKLSKLKEPLPVRLPKLPKPQKRNKFPNKVSFIVGKNPNKASVWTELNRVLVDPAMLKRTLPEIFFFLFHEAGHYLFKDEDKCDLFAVREMLKMGFNPSQCFFAVRDALGNYPLSLERKICIHKKLFPDG